MATNLEKSKEQTVTPAIVSSVVEPIATGKFIKPGEEPQDDDDELEIDVDDDSEESEVEQTDDETEDQAEDEVEEVKPEPKLTREQKELRALKSQAKKKDSRIAELEQELAKKKDSTREDELASKYIEEGHDEGEAKKRAKDEIKQSTMEQQLELLLFEKKNRKVLSMYPQSDDDLDKIVKASKLGIMTVEQICRGLYGKETPEREKRAVDALLTESEEPQNISVSKAMRTASTPAKTKLNKEQQQMKQWLERKFKKTMTDDEYLLTEK